MRAKAKPFNTRADVAAMTDAELRAYIKRAKQLGLTATVARATEEWDSRNVERQLETAEGTITRAFAEAGFARKNMRWSWCARDAEGNVALSVWTRDLKRTASGALYYEDTPETIARWLLRINKDPSPGWKEWKENVMHAFVTGRTVKLVEITAPAGKEGQGVIGEANFRRNWTGRVVSAGADGTFRVEIDEA